jgi:hypothetical protein
MFVVVLGSVTGVSLPTRPAEGRRRAAGRGNERDPAWIANAYVERIDPDRGLPDLINCACAGYVKNVACKQLGIVEPKTSAHKSVLSMRAKELRDVLDALQRHTDELQSW